ncbi:TonB-dependent receptor domain-containing protein [Maribacter sp. 2307ULW6-5]|uniref:TonB-dependent receptor domain-containing protein n=1 Tax=Maribacter sp. 2307ULW6-5 TaxID=3386275 RepID=UPI0039BC9A02
MTFLTKNLPCYLLLLFLGTVAAHSQVGAISGTLTSESGEPIASANAIIQGTTIGASSGPDGRYNITNIPVGDQMLEISALGYATITQRVTIKENTTLELDQVLREDSQMLNEVVVSGTREEGYIVKKTAALGIPLETVKAPVSISVMSDELLEDLGARNLASVITYVPGIANADNGGSNRENFIVRGFPQTQTFINGIRQSITTEGIRAIETVDRVQVVKGPSGVEASLTSPGGFVNIMTKKPLDTFAAEAFVGGGDFNFFRVGGDITGPLVEGKLNGRIVAAYQQKQFWRDGQQRRPVITVAPSLDWKISDKTNLVAEYEFSWQDDPLDRGIIYLEGAGLEDNFLPRTFSFHGENDELKTQNHRLDLSLNHQFTDWLSARLYYQRNTQSSNEMSFRNGNTEGDGALFQEDGLTFSGNSVTEIFFADFGSELKSETLQLDVTGTFTTDKTSHTLNLGGSLADNTDIFTDEDRDFIYGDYLNELDIFEPNNDQEPVLIGSFVLPNFVRGDKINSVFGQWLAEWTPRFRTVASLRYDAIEVFQRDDISGIGTEALNLLEADFAPDPVELFDEVFDDQLFSYRLGASYDLTKSLTGFVGYSSSGEPQPGVTRDGERIAPIRANSLDGGVKLQLFGGRALATASVYYLERENIAIADPSNSLTEFFLAPLGTAEIKGFELDLTGKLTRDLSFFGGMSVQDSEITQSDDDIVGNRFANVPIFQWSSFINYNGRSLNIKGLDVGLGLVYQGEREANSANQYQLPAYTRLDFALGYTFSNNLQIRTNIFNLLDTTFYTAAQDSIFGVNQIAVGDRRLFQITLTKKW